MNPRLIKTKEALLNAIIRLLDEKQLDDISVSDLCKAAGINRTTFYKYYSVPDDVIIEAAKRIVDNIIYSENKSIHTINDYMLANCQSVYANQQLMTAVFNSRSNLLNIFIKVAEEQYDTEFLNRDDNIFITGGILGILSAWAGRGYAESPEVIADKLTVYTKKLLN